MKLGHECTGDDTITAIDATPIPIFKNTENGGFHQIDKASVLFRHETSHVDCGIKSVGLFSDAEGATPYGTVNDNFDIQIPLTDPVEMKTLYIIAKTETDKTATIQVHLNICPNNME